MAFSLLDLRRSAISFFAQCRAFVIHYIYYTMLCYVILHYIQCTRARARSLPVYLVFEVLCVQFDYQYPTHIYRPGCESAVFYHRAINARRPCELNNWIQLFSSHGLLAFIDPVIQFAWSSCIYSTWIQLFSSHGLLAFIARW
jgi:hypothetical protein